MRAHSPQETYQAFLDLIGADVQHERHKVNRRMFSVFLWCFLAPAVTVAGIIFLVKLNVLPRAARGYAGWLILVFPVLYSLYVLSAEVLVEMPNVFRKGGIANTLTSATREGEWRERVCESLRRGLGATREEWNWIIESFTVDLDQLQYRVRYLTALAGAVFFLITQGIDSLTGTSEPHTTFIKHPVLGMIEMGDADATQFVGLALFLVLLYLSGSQTYQSLKRYLGCAKLVVIEMDVAEQQRQKPRS